MNHAESDLRPARFASDDAYESINKCLFWLDLNARHAIELKETFTFTDLEGIQRARYEYAGELLERILPLLNRLQTAIGGHPTPYRNIGKHWKRVAEEFRQSFALNHTR